MSVAKIKRLISQDKLNEALKELNLITLDKNLHKEIIYQQGRLFNLEKEVSLGVLTYENRSITRNQINKTIFKTIQINLLEHTSFSNTND